MQTKLINNSSSELIIFFTGWGCDDIQFQNMQSHRNILLIWDYSDLNLQFDFSHYKKNYLIAYSAGVFAASLLQKKFPKLDKKVAINGNPLMFDDYYGIPADIIKVFKNLNLSNYMDFRKKYIVINDEELCMDATSSFENSN